jgi:hypothetical protein
MIKEKNTHILIIQFFSQKYECYKFEGYENVSKFESKRSNEEDLKIVGIPFLDYIY